MDIPEATDALRPGDKHVFLSHDQYQRKLTDEQQGPPEIDGIVVHYRGVEIVSIETAQEAYAWSAGGYGQEDRLDTMVSRIENRINADEE